MQWETLKKGYCIFLSKVGRLRMKMSKRQATEALVEGDTNGPSGEPPRKRVVFEPVQIGQIPNLVKRDAFCVHS